MTRARPSHRTASTIGGKTHAEIAHVLGVSRRMVQKIEAAALLKLRQALAAEGYDRGDLREARCD